MNRARTKRQIVRCATILLLVILLASSFALLLHVWEQGQGNYPDVGEDPYAQYLEHQGKRYTLKGNIETVLMLGLDKSEEEVGGDEFKNDKRADFIMLFVLNHETEMCTAIHINRDTIAEINLLGVAGNKVGTVKKQLALAHTYGAGDEVSCRNTADAVSTLLKHVPIDHYMSVTMDAVPVFNDMVGGVEVTINEDFSDIDPTLIKGETVRLQGEQALIYVQSRYGVEDETNVSRMERQRQYLNALYDQTMRKVAEDSDFVISATSTMSEYMISNCSLEKMEHLFEKMSTYTFDTIRVIEGESVLGEQYMEFYPNEQSLMSLVLEMFYQPKK